MNRGIDVFYLSNDDLQKILEIEEGHFADVKRKEIKPSKLTRTLSAFANAEGGELFIGIAEVDGINEWAGFNDMEDANGHIQALEELFPLSSEFRYSFLCKENEKSYILKIEVDKTKAIKNASDDIPYLRRGAQNLPQNTDEKIQQLKRNKGITSFEDEIIATRKNHITDSYAIFEFMDEVIPHSEPEPWLIKQELIQNDKPTVAGLVVYADEPQIPLPKRCGLKIYRYATSNQEGTRDTLQGAPESIDGNIYNQVYTSVNRVTEIIEGIRIMSSEGLISLSYPREALHEIITNALLHRDYSIPDDTHIIIFDNRIEVINPGVLAGHVTVNNIRQTRFPRNPKIVRYVNKFPNPPNKDVGEGMNTAFQRMREMKLKEPIVVQGETSVKIILRHEPLASPEELIMEYLKTHDKIANKQAREIAYIGSENKMKRILQGMVSNGILELVPETTRFTAAYRLKEFSERE